VVRFDLSQFYYFDRRGKEEFGSRRIREEYRMLEEYTTSMYKETYVFFSKLSRKTRLNLSDAGVSTRCLINMFRKHVYEPEVKPILLREDEKIVALGRIDLEEGYLSGIVVGGRFRRRGYGTELVVYLIALAREKGLKKVSLEVKVDNQVAIEFYESLGFISKGQKNEGLFWMEKKLNNPPSKKE
jgi:GNAT superfamily N-acetyltransferase